MPENPTGRVLPVAVSTVRHGFGRSQLRPACKRAKVTYFTSHAIRRLVIDLYYEAGVDVGTVAAQMGQSPQVALKHYRQPTRMDRQRAVAAAAIGEQKDSKVVLLDERRREA